MSNEPDSEILPEQGQGRKLALVLWSGYVGGAEILNAMLAAQMRQLGADITIVFIGTPRSLSERLSRANIPYRSLGFGRGRDVLRYPRRYAAEIARSGPDGALLVRRGFMAAALRVGGYRGPIVAVEHGPLLFEQRDLTLPQQLLSRISRVSGAWTTNAEVAVSDFMLVCMCQHAHARRVLRIYNGIDPDTYLSARTHAGRDAELVVGFVGRLIPGKGADQLIRALTQVGERIDIKLLIAGDGPEYEHLVALAQSLHVKPKIEFLGVVDNMSEFWQRCDVAAVPSDAVESFSMVTLEAMACGMPIVATCIGAIPELIVDGVTGTLVPPGNVDALARALLAYAERPEMRHAHGAAARTRAIERFLIEDCARAYLDLFSEFAPSLDPKH
jgi:glycosyltransferase involved in cell wall biosynthesis